MNEAKMQNSEAAHGFRELCERLRLVGGGCEVVLMGKDTGDPGRAG